ncbi:uncharacterized protein LOC128725024 [Anopheles nili]|uniref:uncharacterized protein LOC128725024 n=1 Tax=Anopheles nili TaxID=185578 RepID=UPI00237AC707|nr:uncharacterized protein LOC128725024 [Anopheles nili]
MQASRKKDRWTISQLEKLVDIWANHYQELKDARGSEEVYQTMVKELAQAGCMASVKSIRGRIHNLSGKYRKEYMLTCCSGKASQWSLFNKIASFFEYTPPVRYQSLGQPMFDMPPYLRMDITMAQSLESRGILGQATHQSTEFPVAHHIDENTMDLDEGDENSNYDNHNGAEQLDQDHSQLESREEANSVANLPHNGDPYSGEYDEEHPQERLGDVEALVEGVQSDGEAGLDVEECHAIFVFRSHLYTDVILIASYNGETYSLPAHRIVLSHFSKVFSGYIEHILKEVTPKTTATPLAIVMQSEIPKKVIKSLLEFMYTGRTKIPEGLVQDFIRIGSDWKIKGLEDVAMATGTNVTNVIENLKDGLGKRVSFETNATYSRQRKPSETSSTKRLSKPKTHTQHPNDQKKLASNPERFVSDNTSTAITQASPEDDSDTSIEVSSNIGDDLLRSDDDDNDESDEDSENEDVDDAENGEPCALKQNKENSFEDEVSNEENDDPVLLDAKDDDSLQFTNNDDQDEDYYDENEDSSDYDANEQENEEQNNGNDLDNDLIDADTDDNEDLFVHEDKNIANIELRNSISVRNPLEPADDLNLDKESIEHNNSRLPQLNHVVSDPSVEEYCNVTRTSPGVHTSDTPAQVPSHVSQIIRKRPMQHPFQANRSQQTKYIKTTEGMSEANGLGNAPPQQTLPIEFNCKICGKAFTTSEDWLQHIVYMHAPDEQLRNSRNDSAKCIKLTQCDLCSKYLNSEYGWVQHILKKHTERYPHLYDELSASDIE